MSEWREITDDEEACKHCKFFHPIDEGKYPRGQCRIRDPRKIEPRWPRVQFYEFCGRFLRKPKG